MAEQRKDTQRTGADDSDMTDEDTQAQSVGGSAGGDNPEGATADGVKVRRVTVDQEE